MPRLCRMCKAESDTEDCMYCGGPTVEVEEVFEVRYKLVCQGCNSVVVKKIDHDSRDILGMGFWETRPCPRCCSHQVHEIILLGSNIKSYDSYLEKAYKEELKKGE